MIKTSIYQADDLDAGWPPGIPNQMTGVSLTEARGHELRVLGGRNAVVRQTLSSTVLRREISRRTTTNICTKRSDLR